jgi:pimeloyl-ACP methyl ester carboxylesterase
MRMFGSDNRQEFSPFTERRASELEVNAFFTRLADDGRESLDVMSEVTVGDCYRDTLEALTVGHAIGEHVVVGSSTGATLATVLAKTHPDDVHAIVAVSANYGPRNRTSWLTWLPRGEQIGELLMGRYRSGETDIPEQERSTGRRGGLFPAGSAARSLGVFFAENL